MKVEPYARESHRANELASEYRSKGYLVTAPRTRAETPAFLVETGYVPDLIAVSERESLIIEVKSQQTTSDLSHLSQIAELVNAQEGWTFVLVFTNPRDASTSSIHASAEKARRLLAKSVAIGTEDETHTEASFLFGWAALEASLRLLPEEKKSGRTPNAPWTLIRNAAMAGHIDRKDAQSLERFFKIRNSLLHAGNEEPPQRGDVDLLRRTVEEIIRASAEREV